MANTKSAKKQVRVNERRRVINRSVKTLCRTNIRKAEELIDSGELEAAKRAVTEALSALDRAAEKDVIHSNNAARRKSRLVSKLNQMAASPGETPKTA